MRGHSLRAALGSRWFWARTFLFSSIIGAFVPWGVWRWERAAVFALISIAVSVIPPAPSRLRITVSRGPE